MIENVKPMADEIYLGITIRFHGWFTALINETRCCRQLRQKIYKIYRKKTYPSPRSLSPFNPSRPLTVPLAYYCYYTHNHLTLKRRFFFLFFYFHVIVYCFIIIIIIIIDFISCLLESL